MSDDRRRGGGEDGEDGGPGLVYMPFVIMEELTDKLRLLDYDRSFLRKMNIKPISRYHMHSKMNIKPISQYHMLSKMNINPITWHHIYSKMNIDPVLQYHMHSR